MLRQVTLSNKCTIPRLIGRTRPNQACLLTLITLRMSNKIGVLLIIIIVCYLFYQHAINYHYLSANRTLSACLNTQTKRFNRLLTDQLTTPSLGNYVDLIGILFDVNFVGQTRIRKRLHYHPDNELNFCLIIH